jgi:hypothetical protein
VSMSEVNIPFAGRPPINVPFSEGSRRAAPTPEEAEDQQQVSRFESATQRAGLQTPEQAAADLTTLLTQAGVDVTEPFVQRWIDTVPDDLPVQTMQFYIAQLAEKYPAVPVTQYSQALETSGFTSGTEAVLAPAARGLAGLGLSTDEIRRTNVTGANFEVQADTGWVLYANGVLVNPADGTVVFDPTSDAPGSPNWLRKVQGWDESKVSEWRSRLFDYGYLTKEQAKVKGVDQVFLSQIRAYHVARYQNFGKALPTDQSAIGGAGEDEFQLTAKDFQAQIQNDVREQYRRVFGDDPSDAELREWSQFVTNSAMKAQKRFERKGATPSSALSLAATEAEERLVAGFETSPEAELLAEANSDENTRLRDAFAQAARVSSALGG